ncbi:lysozyme inhibitor [Brucella oryzae]|uniref:lysozyme inhibitor n=1 Tax=Brucella oryzae TaxID=335286 RepID=UPI001B8140D2|nr:lysozyme inhibitor [Brucella oryzae]MBR7650814.1 lysozyme inhibitor [Brucella oryzae]
MAYCKRYIGALFVIATGPAMLFAPSASAQAQNLNPIERVDYICERGVVVPVTYIRNGSAPEFAVLDAEGKMIALQWHDNLKKYVAIDEQDSYRWSDKDGQAVLSHLEADHTAKEVTLLSACRSDDPEE